MKKDIYVLKRDGREELLNYEKINKVSLEFVEGMNQEQFSKVEKFFDNLPKLREEVKITCGKCGYNHTIEVEGLESFFG